jgi:hypothetical protein
MKFIRGEVLLDTRVSPVSPWTLRAPGRVVRYLLISVGMVLGGEKLEHSTKGVYSTDAFQMGFF